MHDLTIPSATVSNSGEFTCVADNGLDKDTVTALLIVKGKALSQRFKFQKCFIRIGPSGLFFWFQLRAIAAAAASAAIDSYSKTDWSKQNLIGYKRGMTRNNWSINQ